MERGVHDLGGLPGGPVDKSEHDYLPWEKSVDAILSLLVNDKRLMRVDELRRGIESLDADAYNQLSYYQRWIASIAAILVEKSVFTKAELEARIAGIDARLRAGATS